MNPGRPPAIEFRNVSISFDGAPALQNVSFTLPRGEMLCVTVDIEIRNGYASALKNSALKLLSFCLIERSGIQTIAVR